MNNNLNNFNTLNSIQYFTTKENFQKSNNKTKLKILYFNAISMRNKLSDIIFFIDSFKSPIHIIVISETRLYENENKFYDLPNYVAYHSNRKENKDYGRGAGTAVYIHSSLCSAFVFEECIENKFQFLIVKLIEHNMHIIQI